MLVDLLALFLVVALLSACAAPYERPDPAAAMDFRDRAVSTSEEGIRVSAALPSVEEAESIFGIDFSEENIDPVWLQLENNTERYLWFLPTGMDPEYFAPLEVSFAYHKRFSSDSKATLDEHIDTLNFKSPIAPGETVSGFVFTNQDKGAKVISVDLVSFRWAKNFTLIVPIPGENRDMSAYIAALHAKRKVIEIGDEARLKASLEQLPCCTTDEDGVPGEPLNFVVIGELEDFVSGFIRRDYRYDQISPRYLFGRVQDLQATKQSDWVSAQPHMLRFWLTDITFRGKSVWVGSITTPLGGRFGALTDNATDNPIEVDIDEARNDLVQDLVYSQGLTRIGFAKGVGLVPVSDPRPAPNGGRYHTDGLRAVFAFGHENTSLAEIGFFEWERLVDHYRKQFRTVQN